MPQQVRIKLIVLHGWGGSFAAAVRSLLTLQTFPAYWHNGSFYIERRSGLVLRELLSLPEPDAIQAPFVNLIVSRLLCSNPHAPADLTDNANYIRLTEQWLTDHLGHLGVPVLPGARLRRARQLEKVALAAIRPFLATLEELDRTLSPPAGAHPTELQARALILDRTRDLPQGPLLLALLESIRAMQETGGDLDTVASAALYTRFLAADAARHHRPFVYGADYRYAFLNYHDSLRPLAAWGPSDVYMADLPIGAFPEFQDDVRHLGQHDVRIARFEDHHPYDPAHLRMLQALQDEGHLDVFALSGPTGGGEQAAPTCAADMVYERTIANTDADGPGARALRDAAHAEDFVTGRTPLSRLLTDLIKGGVCKRELVELLVTSMQDNDAMDRLVQRGWQALATARNIADTEREDVLLDHAYMLTLRRPPSAPLAEQGAQALGPGSDVPDRRPARADTAPYVRILVALAPRAEPGQPRLSTGKAIEYYARTVPDADYVFYCFGASILVARRVNQADFSFNLGSMMPRIGSAGDGGHPGAAVCRPDSAPDYPVGILGHVSPANFRLFSRYLAHRISRMGYDVLRVENTSHASRREEIRRGGTRLLMITIVSALLGLLLILLLPSFRTRAILDSNRDFFPQLVEGREPNR